MAVFVDRFVEKEPWPAHPEAPATPEEPRKKFRPRASTAKSSRKGPGNYRVKSKYVTAYSLLDCTDGVIV